MNRPHDPKQPPTETSKRENSAASEADAMTPETHSTNPDQQPDIAALLAARSSSDLETPDDLLGKILDEIPSSFGNPDLGPAASAEDQAAVDPPDNVVRGRFGQRAQLLSLAAALVLLAGAGWIAVRLGSPAQRAPLTRAEVPSEAAAASTASPHQAEKKEKADETASTPLAEEMVVAPPEPKASAVGGAASQVDRRQNELERSENLRQRRQELRGGRQDDGAEEVRDQLRALGYVSSAPAATPPPGRRPEPEPERTARSRSIPRPVAKRVEEPAAAPSRTAPVPPRPAVARVWEVEAREKSDDRESEVAGEDLSLLRDRAERPPFPEDDTDEDAVASSFAADEVAVRRAPPLVDPALDPQSTFGLDVDTGSYTTIRAALRAGRLPAPERVRIEEVVNFFDYGDPAPRRGDFALRAEVGDVVAPIGGDSERRLVRFSIRARDVVAAERRPATLVFVVDTSGSMQQDGRLETVKQALELLLDGLRADDRIALVRYADDAELLLAATADHEAIRRAIARLHPAGSTNLQAGLRVGYQEAERAFDEGRSHRVLLLSDGIANVGDTEALPILRSVADWAARGVELTTVGVGMGHNDPLLERLADRGDGRYAYVDTLEEARRIFSEQLTGTLETVARDARAQVTFDPGQVAGYRLLGYDNRALPDHVFRHDAVDAGEIGAGHRVTVLYEVEMRPDAPRRSRRPAATLDLRWRSIATGAFEEVRLELPAVELRQGARGDATRSGGFELAAVAARFAEELQQPRPSAAVLESLSRRTRRLPGEELEDSEVLELAYLMSEAAELARR
ncbi:MAG: DUF3520 domain-containing protein [Acidobacteria bacterium]|nr:MAG: DUF3520 domain-containing protein [Acidobacteriota bacterium]REK00886.1 MAG: DUF3520 domain-containing protein [Acidobacteriota bacterium]